MKNKKIAKLIDQSESNLKDIANQMSEEFLKMEEKTTREMGKFDDHEMEEKVETPSEPDLIDYAVQNIMKGVFK